VRQFLGRTGRPADGWVMAVPPEVPDAEGRMRVDYTERLRRLAISDDRFLHDGVDWVGGEHEGLDAKTLALVRLAALVAVGGAEPSYGALADGAVDAGATVVEIVDVLVGVIPVVGLPCVVAASPKLALALGYDISDELEHHSSGG